MDYGDHFRNGSNLGAYGADETHPACPVHPEHIHEPDEDHILCLDCGQPLTNTEDS